MQVHIGCPTDPLADSCPWPSFFCCSLLLFLSSSTITLGTGIVASFIAAGGPADALSVASYFVSGAVSDVLSLLDHPSPSPIPGGMQSSDKDATESTLCPRGRRQAAFLLENRLCDFVACLGAACPNGERKANNKASQQCAMMEDAYRVFNEMKVKDVVSGNVMVIGCSQDCNFGDAVELFEMKHGDNRLLNLAAWSVVIAGDNRLLNLMVQNALMHRDPNAARSSSPR